MTLNLNPVEYVPADGGLSYNPEMTVEITLEKKRNVNNFYRRETIDLEWVKKLVTNPEISSTYPTEKIESNKRVVR